MATVDPPAAATSRREALWPQNRRHAFIAAWLLWAVPMLVMAALVIHDPWKHTVTFGSYHPSAKHWWARQSLYIGPAGMNYLPHFAVLFSPFDFLPVRVGEILWRLCATASLSGGLWLLARELFGADSERPFLWATILAMPLSLGALRNGNANAIFGGVTLLAIVAILQARWWLAVGWMFLATALKPLGIVLLLLASIYYMPVARRLPVALLGLALFPFCFGPPDYVLGQYREAWRDLSACAVVTEHRFADLNGILRTFGTPLSPSLSTIVRALAGGLTAIAWLWGARRLNEKRRWRSAPVLGRSNLRPSPAPGNSQIDEPPCSAAPGDGRAPVEPTAIGGLPALWLYALTTAYLMLFNPMSEANSYVILAPALGVWGAFFLLGDDPAGGRGLGWAIAAMALSMSLLPNILRPWLGNYFALFWHPFMTILFIGALIGFIGRAGGQKLRPQPAPSL